MAMRSAGYFDGADVGIGPTEPTLWQKFLMPLKEPIDSAVAPKGHE